MDMKMIVPIFVVFALLLAGCAPQIQCASPSKVIGSKCCIDQNDNGVCDSDEPEEEAEVEPEPEFVPEVEESETESSQEPAPVMAAPEPEAEPAQELSEGVFKIQLGEPKKYVEINKLEMHRYSSDKVMLDDLWYTVRNVGTEVLNPEIRVRAENVRVNDYETSSSSQEFTYNLEPLAPGEKEVIKLSTNLRYSQMNKTKTITISVYERFVAPKEVLGSSEMSFIPRDELESMEISWLPDDD